MSIAVLLAAAAASPVAGTLIAAFVQIAMLPDKASMFRRVTTTRLSLRPPLLQM
jgi:hypothetical protein